MALPADSTRSFFTFGIADLEEYFSESLESAPQLQSLLEELGHRTTARALLLQEQVQTQLNRLNSPAAKSQPNEVAGISAPVVAELESASSDGTSGIEELGLSRIEARCAHRYFKRGVFPAVGTDRFTVGRTKALATLRQALNESSDGSQTHCFVEADYGGGKSHFLKASEWAAMQAGFAISWITLDAYNHAFNQPSRYVHSLMENLRAPSLAIRGLASLCEYWLLHEQREQLMAWCENDAPWFFRYAISRLAQREDDDLHQRMWNRSMIECRDLIFSAGRAVVPKLYERMNLANSLCRAMGLNGCVFLFDEAECIATQLTNIRSRMLAYDILENFTGAVQFPNTVFIFAATPDFASKIDDDMSRIENYDTEYPKAKRFLTRWEKGSVSRIQLSGISRKANTLLCRRIRESHGTAYDWNPRTRFTDERVQAFVNSEHDRGVGQREIVTAFANALDICEQYPECEVDKIFQL